MLIYALSAVLSAAATIITFTTGLLFFTKGTRYGKPNDISSVFQVLLSLWLIGINTLALTNPQFPTALAWFGILAGLGYLATVIGFLKSGKKHPLFYLGSGLLALSYPTWAIWLSLLLFFENFAFL